MIFIASTMQTVWPGSTRAADLHERLGARLSGAVERPDQRRQHGYAVVLLHVADREHAGGHARAGGDAQAGTRARRDRPAAGPAAQPLRRCRRAGAAGAALDLDLVVAGGDREALTVLPSRRLIRSRASAHTDWISSLSGVLWVFFVFAHVSPVIGGSVGWRPGVPNLRKRS